MIVLGVDPGSHRTGYAVIKRIDKNQFWLQKADTINPTSVVSDHLGRLKVINDHIINIIHAFKPGILAIESPFYNKSIRSALTLGRVQGLIIAQALSADLEVYEYAPKEIKKSVTGMGNASKLQVAEMVQKLLVATTIKNMSIDFNDTSDAIATALCHLLGAGGAKENKKPKANSWEHYVRSNPNRLA